ncbi:MULTISPECIES: hypothetical protein [Pseudomonas]|uniref:hypothetical protein n=1 Tax=Pseudomonas TaxID=286 RepID=UPI00211E2AF6|nr:MULTISPECIES: hypothetical protein [unclassified Pseudomonas]MDR8383970.1 hypothetical protein [Pseudomonas sp. JL2]WNZ80818.1 hypothetical protein QOM08_12225 [Pseudomonas sp. P105]
MPQELSPATCSAATVMFGVPEDMTLDVIEQGEIRTMVNDRLTLATYELNLRGVTPTSFIKANNP